MPQKTDWPSGGIEWERHEKMQPKNLDKRAAAAIPWVTLYPSFPAGGDGPHRALYLLASQWDCNMTFPKYSSG